MIAKVKNLMNVARLTTIALCSMLVFTTCSKDNMMEELTVDDLTMEQYVQKTVLAYVPNGKVISSELTTDDGMEVYHIEVANSVVNYGFVVKLAAGMLEGTLISDNLIFVKSSTYVNMDEFISDEEARDIALNLAGGGEVTLCKLTYIHGEAEYEVVVVNGIYTYQIFIDGYTGIINRFVRYSTPTDTIPDNPGDPGNPGNPQTNVTAEAAQNIALAKVGGGTIARVETKYHPHGIEFNVLIVYGDYRYCVHINASTGYIINMHSDQITTVAPNAYGYTPAVSATQAKAIAIQSAGGSGVVTECKLEYKPHLGALSYHIHVAKGQYEYCVELHATTGVVFKVEPRYKP
jgi:uncharacterized membrane protein YkoI